MPATVIVGLQWGDEGKGKTTDFLAEQVAIVVRYQGGDNAGHTVVLGDEVFKLHLVPVGRALPAHHVGHRAGRRRQPGDADRRARRCSPRAASTSAASGSARAAHVIMPYHVALERRREARLGGAKVGTTGRGIGPGVRGSRAGGSACAWRTCSTRTLCRDEARARPARQERRARARPTASRASSSTTLVEQASAWGERLAAAPRRHDLARPGRPRGAASTSCSRAPRARSSTSTTARTRS